MQFWFMIVLVMLAFALIAGGLLLSFIINPPQFTNAAPPRPLWAWAETIGWLLLLVPLVNHLADTSGSLTAQLTWYLAIGPHEIGHLICMPFGTFIMFAGGSIWQVLLWLLLAAYSLLRHRRIGQALLFGTVAAHSFLNMSVYIRDAQERDLDLLPGFTEENHDWWNLLNMAGLLRFDDLFANIAVGFGVLLALACVVLGVFSTWALPRTGGKSRI